MTANPSLTRRRFLKSAAGGVALAAPLGAVHARHQDGQGFGFLSDDYGPIAPVADRTTGLPLLKLPKGFRYWSYGWTGDLMADGTYTPDRHDGMAVVDIDFSYARGFELILIRNHERGPSAPDNPLPVIGGGSAPTYDTFVVPGVVAGIGGGTTEVRFNQHGFTSSNPTLAGTLVNCAGGPTPWGSWLTCEETTIRGSLIGAKDHGYVFEVPSPRLGMASARPIRDMGLMDHEAVAVDPVTGYVYLTEDNGPTSGFYRYRPNNRSRRLGTLEEGGVLEMLKVVDQPNADLRDAEFGDRFDIDWVRIDEPDSDPEEFVSPDPVFPPIEGAGRSGPFLQGEAAGGAVFRRGEGCWYHHGTIYFVDTSGGPAGKGVVWALKPDRRHGHGGHHQRRRDELVAIFSSPAEVVADNPDNLTVSPRGGILVCEDGGGVVVDGALAFGSRLIGIDHRGDSYVFAENNVVIEELLADKPFIGVGDYRGQEFAGATFSPFGRTLFVNIQTPGITFAIEGPWWRGSL